MKIFGLGVPELILILLVVLLIFGPKNLPKLGSALGKTIKGLREGMDAGKKEVQEDSDDEVVIEEAQQEAPEETAEAASSEKPKKVVKKVVVKKAE